MVGWHDLERFRTRYGDADESIEVALSRIIGEENLDTFRTGLEPAYETKHADAERILRAELEQAIVLSIQNVVRLARATVDEEQAAMGERTRQFPRQPKFESGVKWPWHEKLSLKQRTL